MTGYKNLTNDVAQQRAIASVGQDAWNAMQNWQRVELMRQARLADRHSYAGRNGFTPQQRPAAPSIGPIGRAMSPRPPAGPLGAAAGMRPAVEPPPMKAPGMFPTPQPKGLTSPGWPVPKLPKVDGAYPVPGMQPQPGLKSPGETYYPPINLGDFTSGATPAIKLPDETVKQQPKTTFGVQPF
jgi:hypothetical protein